MTNGGAVCVEHGGLEVREGEYLPTDRNCGGLHGGGELGPMDEWGLTR